MESPEVFIQENKHSGRDASLILTTYPFRTTVTAAQTLCLLLKERKASSTIQTESFWKTKGKILLLLSGGKEKRRIVGMEVISSYSSNIMKTTQHRRQTIMLWKLYHSIQFHLLVCKWITSYQLPHCKLHLKSFSFLLRI